jgi:predicted O-methyltransferase YrrM
MTQAHATTPLTVDGLEELYHRYAADLRLAREYQRELLTQRAMRPKLDDIEAELTYLLLRDVRPTAVVEIGSFHGWSTSWILRALRDNGHGQLSTFDIVDHVRRTVPEELADGRWTFVGGDVRTNLRRIPLDVGYLFLDAAHTAGFARWYTKSLFPRLDAGTPVSVHDVFHGRRRGPCPKAESCSPGSAGAASSRPPRRPRPRPTPTGG